MELAKPAEDSCLGMIEVASVPVGIRAADAVIKEAPVKMLVARPVTPAKYLALFEGEVEAVSRSLARGREVAGARFLDETFLPSPHEQLVQRLRGGKSGAEIDALGVFETTTVAACLQALDGALKEGEVSLVDLRLAMGLGGHAFFAIAGEVSSIEVACERAERIAGEARRDVVVIPQPDRDSLQFLSDPASPFRDLL